jgi:dihydroorotate dehydrogenase electron transfer subunit
MLDKKVTVKSMKDLGASNYLLTLAAAEQGRLAQPGQFVMLKCADEVDELPLLRRPFSIFDTHPNAKSGRPGGLDLLVKDVGIGSHKLALLRPGRQIQVLGPQGRPFQVQPEMRNRITAACLVAGGVGIAALYILARRLLALNVTPHLFYGGRSKDDLVLREYFERIGIKLFCATEDGSLGERGLVTAPLAGFLQARARSGARIYTCGPWAMMKAVPELAGRHAVPCEVSLEARMGCSLGACMGCVIHGWDSHGEEQYFRVCLEGPIMDSRSVDWETSPF